MNSRERIESAFFEKLRSDCSQNELFSLYETARRLNPTGTICDVGCGSGGSTASICRGLADAGVTPRRQVHAYDLFEDHRNPHASMEAFEQTTSDFSEFIRIVKGDLRRPSIVPDNIDLLFVDAAKSLVLHEAINSAFLPNLRFPCILLNQDFGRPHHYWIHLMFAELIDSAARFKIVDDMITVELSASIDIKSIPGLKPSTMDFDTALSLLSMLRTRLLGATARDGFPYTKILLLSVSSLAIAHRRKEIAVRYLAEFQSECSKAPRHLQRPIDHLERSIAAL